MIVPIVSIVSVTVGALAKREFKYLAQRYFYAMNKKILAMLPWASDNNLNILVKLNRRILTNHQFPNLITRVTMISNCCAMTFPIGDTRCQ